MSFFEGNLKAGNWALPPVSGFLIMRVWMNLKAPENWVLLSASAGVPVSRAYREPLQIIVCSRVIRRHWVPLAVRGLWPWNPAAAKKFRFFANGHAIKIRKALWACHLNPSLSQVWEYGSTEGEESTQLSLYTEVRFLFLWTKRHTYTLTLLCHVKFSASHELVKNVKINTRRIYMSTRLKGTTLQIILTQ